MAASQSFKRIRMVTKEDLVACYPLLITYLRDPEAANSVTECIIDLPGRGSWPFAELSPPPPVTGPSTPDNGVHDLLIEYASNLGLGDEMTAIMLQALEEKRNALERDTPDKSSHEPKRLRYQTIEDSREYNSTLATLLLSLLPNLTTVRIFNVRSGLPLDHFLKENNAGNLPTPYLQNLHTVLLQAVNCQDERSYDYLIDMAHFRYFYQLPAIHTFSLEAIEDYQADHSAFPRGKSAAKKIHIGHSDMSGKMIRLILGVPKALEEFSWSTYGLMNTDGGSSSVDGAGIGKILYGYRGSLKVLDLDGDVGHEEEEEEEEEEDEDEDEDEEKEDEDEREEDLGLEDSDAEEKGWDSPSARDYPPNSIGRLDDFGSLTHLSIKLGLLLGFSGSYEPVPSASYRLVKALPPQLESLRLYGYKKGDVAAVDEQVTELLEKKSELFPNLTQIEGVDEPIPAVSETWDAEPGEDEVWERLPENLDWITI